MSDGAGGNVRILDRSALPNDAARLARELIGALVIREPSIDGDERCIARIVETEAYVPDDAACHAFGGPTARNASLFLERGHAYVYFIYGMYWCFNVSAERAGIGAGVLVRAGEPIAGLATMRRRRGVERARDLLRGPGRFARAFAIDRALDGADLCSTQPERNRGLYLARGARIGSDVGCSARIGLSRETDRRLRYFAIGNAFVSGPKRLNAATSLSVT